MCRQDHKVFAEIAEFLHVSELISLRQELLGGFTAKLKIAMVRACQTCSHFKL
jgi:hypothetical protein